jgi:hypothetical protein
MSAIMAQLSHEETPPGWVPDGAKSSWRRHNESSATKRRVPVQLDSVARCFSSPAAHLNLSDFVQAMGGFLSSMPALRSRLGLLTRDDPVFDRVVCGLWDDLFVR